MDRKDFRSLLTKLTDTTRTAQSAPSRLLRRVGKAMGMDGRASASNSFELLENRAMLEGSFAAAFSIAINGGTGRGASVAGAGAGVINSAAPGTDNDFFSFVAPGNDFVSVLADTSNESPASTLNTRIQVFNSSQVLVASGTNNGALTSGLASDGWAGFLAQAGQTYFVVVSSDGTGPTVGTYTVRVNAKTTAFTIEDDPFGVAREENSPLPDYQFILPTPILGQLGGIAIPVTGRLRQDDIVYKYTVPAGAKWDNLVTINAQSTQTNLATRLNTRLDIYTSAGVLVRSDSDAGRINDAYSTIRAKPGETYYIRVRSDEIRNTNISLATGPFYLVLDAVTTPLAMNPVTRIARDLGGGMIGFGDPSVPPNPNMQNPVFQTSSYEFTSQGTGLTIISAQQTGLDPNTDAALHLYDDTGALVAFNNNFAGRAPQITAQLVGGKRYFVVVDGFDVTTGTQFTLTIESNHTFNPTTPIDDHVNTPTFDPAQPISDATRRQFELASALVWNAAVPTLDADNNILRDRGLKTTATGTGRLHTPGDTDLFKFTPQVSMLQDYDGNNDDLGTSLFIGGSFDSGDPNNPWPTTSRDLAIWDAADYFYTGAQNFDPNFNVTYGFNDNADTAATGRAEIYSMIDYDPGTPATVPSGMNRRWLVVGGDFDLIIPTAFGPVTFKNLAVWFQDFNTGRWGWGSLGDVDGPVRALTSFLPEESFESRDDPDVEVDSDRPVIGSTAVPYLVIGGEFTDIDGNAAANVATFDVVNGWQAIGAGVNGPVFALTSYNPEDFGDERAASVGPPVLGFIANGRDIPNSLFIGGQFTSVDGVNARNLALWDGVDADDVFGGPSTLVTTNAGPNGPVFALTTYVGWDPDGPTQDPLPPVTNPRPTGSIEAPARVLIVGGQFTTIANGNGQNIPAANLAAWGFLDSSATGSRELDRPDYNPRGGWQQVGAGVTAANGNGDPVAVLALTQWDPPNINNDDENFEPILVIGGAFNVGGMQNLTGFAVDTDGDLPQALGFGWFSDSEGADGIVRALTTLTDAQEPGIATDLNSGVPQEVLYVGGDFGQLSNGPLAPPVIATRIGQYSAFHDPLSGQDFFQFTAMASGVDNDDPAAQPPAVVFALSAFDDGNPLEWDRHDRRADRLQIVVAPDPGAFFNARVRVYDSNFNLVYDFGRPGSETISPINPDPAGMLDGSLQAPGFNEALEGITVWAGETYYIEVSDFNNAGTTRGGSGRYTLSVTADAAATDLNGDGVLDDVNAQIDEEPDAGRFTDAFNLKIDTALASGDGTNARGSATATAQPPLNGNSHRTQHITPSLNDSFVEGYDLGNIQTIDDTDLYMFRAEFDGTAEIRIDTTDLANEFGEALGGDVPGTFAGQAKTIQSRLDSALRVFRNDFVQIGYNDDNYAQAGEFQNDFAGTIGGRFTRRDARVVINVVAGNFYFIQVESGLKFKLASPADPNDRVDNIGREIDSRFESGAYRLIINQMPNQNAEIVNGQIVLDDHQDGNNPGDEQRATVIPINDTIGSIGNGTGSITGVIRDTPLNPFDFDLFQFTSPGSGTVDIRVIPTGTGNGLFPTFTLYEIQNGVATAVIGTANPLVGGGVRLTAPVTTGQSFIIEVSGQGLSEGAYRVDISGIKAEDDIVDAGKLAAAPEINLLDFQGVGAASGRIESRGDSDVFKFRVNDFSLFTASVISLDATLTPMITIYEVSDDPSGNPILLRIGTANATGTTATVSFPVTPNRQILDDQGNIIREYPYYYMVISGVNPNTDFGRYNIAVNFPATDDHPDGDSDLDGTFDTGQYSSSTRIAIDSATGQGSSTGIIEVASDSDLFVFTAPASGTATLVISRPGTSTIRARVSILDDFANVIASGLAADDLLNGTATVSFAAVRNTNYHVVIEGFDDALNPNVNTTKTGAYTISVLAPPVDDYPNAGEFTLANAASNIALNSATGLGRIGGTAGNDPTNPRLSYNGDTDLFTFTTIRDGNVTITVTPFDTAVGRIAPSLTLFDAAGNQIQTISGGRLATIALTISNATVGTRYYVLVGAVSGVPQTTGTGEYGLAVQGPAQPGGTGGDIDAIDFDNPTTIVLNPRTGDGQSSDVVNVINDRDLFKITTTAAGKVFIQLTAGNGSLLRASITILDEANELVTSQVAFDSDGIPGAIANVMFNGDANKVYYIVVDGLGDSTGSYTVKVNTQPLSNELVYPEGFASANTREFVSIINPGDVDAVYTIRLRYETGSLETVVGQATVRAHSRSGLTIIDPSYSVPGLRLDTPYAIVINSSQPLGATLAHYDFGKSIGDSFTETTSSTWDFARVEREPGAVNDFIVFYNPNNFDVYATVTANVNGQTFAATLRFGAFRRGGFSINDITNFPTGVYGVTLSVTPVSSANLGTYIGVVASLSHYDLQGAAAFGLLGDPTGGSTSGVITNLAQGSTVSSEVNFFNPGSTPATVNLTGTYIRTSLPPLNQTILIPARSSVRIKGDTLGLAANQPIGLTYTSNVPIVASSDQLQNGDADSTSAATTVGTQVFFGDAYVDPRFPGLQPESLFFYNPGSTSNTISIKLDFFDQSTPAIFTVVVGPRGFAEVRLDTRTEITSRSGPTWFAIDAFSTLPFAATMVHYDLALQGGWATSGVPFGIMGPLSKIT